MMPKSRIYFDYNASSPLRLSAREAMTEAFDQVGNPSSVHAEGRASRGLVETARETIAELMGVSPRGLVFTSGATEAACLALRPALADGGAPFETLIVSAGEHPCVMVGHGFDPARVVIAPVTGQGVIDLDALARALERAPGRALVALQSANNETGVLQPVAQAAALVHARNGRLICDAVQSFGRSPTPLVELGADALIVSAHKLGGPKGVGALAFASDALHIADALIRGGGQEGGARGGTENLIGVAGFAAAAREACARACDEWDRLAVLRERMERAISQSVAPLIVMGADTPRLANTSCFAAEGASSSIVLMALDLEGVSASAGSACSSGKVGGSTVLNAMGVEASLAACALRVSMGVDTNETDVDRFCETLEKSIKTIRARRARRAA